MATQAQFSRMSDAQVEVYKLAATLNEEFPHETDLAVLFWNIIDAGDFDVCLVLDEMDFLLRQLNEKAEAA